MVYVMVVRAGPDGQEMMQTPGELVATVRVDSLEQPQGDPDVHGEDVKLASDGAPEDGRADGADAEDQYFDGRGVFGGKAEGGRVLVVDLVDAAVERTPVQGTVEPVVPGIFEDEEDCNLISHSPRGGEGNAGIKAEVLSHGVEKPDERVSNKYKIRFFL